MGVLDPLRVVIDNYPEGQSENCESPNNPEDPSAGTRKVPFSREIYIERDDFMEDPPKKFFRLAPGREVRLRSAYFITCTSVVKDDAGNIVELRARTIPPRAAAIRPTAASRRRRCTGSPPSTPSTARCGSTIACSTSENPGGERRLSRRPQSAVARRSSPHAKLEPSVRGAAPLHALPVRAPRLLCRRSRFHGDALVFNRTVTLKDAWAKIREAGLTNTGCSTSTPRSPPPWHPRAAGAESGARSARAARRLRR